MKIQEKMRKPMLEAKYLNVENTDRYRPIIRLFYLKYGNYSEPALLKDEIRVTCDRIFDCFVSIVSLFMCRAYVGHDF